ncbi:MAG: type II secretion system major pseudopilin GspG [Spirochaetes bacterium]|nr:type II secretion system major pseudopilin GspG [Spirochaetota bacterium]
MKKFSKFIKRIRIAEDGFSTLEMVIVIAIISLFVTVGGSQLFKLLDKGKVASCNERIRKIEIQLESYNRDNQNYPSTEQGLKALVEPATTDPVPQNFQQGGYLVLKDMKDPWGHDYIYRSPGDEGRNYEIISLGSDGKEGGEGYAADIRSWE